MTAWRGVDGFADLDVLVLGDALLDDYLIGGGLRICREAPVPAVTVRERRAEPGGAANVAANAAALGARVRFLSVVGDDADGVALRTALRRSGVPDVDLLTVPGRQTVTKRRIFAGEQMLVRYDEGSRQPLPPDVVAELTRRLRALFAGSAAVLVSDYGYGVLDPALREVLAEAQRATPRVLVVDARSLADFRAVGATAVKPNYDEVRPLLDLDADEAGERASAVTSAGDRLLDVTGAEIVAVTLDVDGAVVCERGRPPYRTYSRPASHARACGAGDSFTAALGLALAAGADTPTAAELASAAAAVVVDRDGTSTCSADDLREHLADSSARLEEPARLAQRMEFHRRQGRRVVFTNGCFDILHRGHVDFLNSAKALGDVLVVGLNSDEGIRRLKGPDRPVNALEDRAEVLAALSCVDHLAAFDGATAVGLIEMIRPDVYVKGGDYTVEMLPEAPYVQRLGGLVRILPYTEDRSTTAIIDRVRGRGAGAPASAAERP